MSEQTNPYEEAIDADVEALELYLDGELVGADRQAIDRRLVAEPALAARFDVLRGQRSLRVEAMAAGAAGDAASIERLIASVRAADRRPADADVRGRLGWLRRHGSAIGAAACLAFGVLVGVQLQRGQLYPNGQLPTQNFGGGAPVDDASFNLNADAAHGAYVVSVRGPDGRERVLTRVRSLEEAQRFIDLVRGAAGSSGMSDLRVRDGGY